MFLRETGYEFDNSGNYDDHNIRPTYGDTGYLRNPLHHHHLIKIEVMHETPKALLLKDAKGQYWVPKKLLKYKDIHDGEMIMRQWNGFTIIYLD